MHKRAPFPTQYVTWGIGIAQLHAGSATTNLTDNTGVEFGFNQSDFRITEGQSKAIDVCAKVTSGTLQQNISVYIDTVNKDHGGILKVMLCLLLVLSRLS